MESNPKQEVTGTVEPGILRLSWEEVCARYPDQWVVLVEFDWIDRNGGGFRTARVLGQGATRKEANRVITPLPEWIRHFWTRYTGEARIPVNFRLGLGLL